MADDYETRTVPRSWREYLVEARESVAVFDWLRREILTDASKPWLKKLFAGLVALTILHALEPYFIRMIVDALATREDFTPVLVGVGGYFGILFAGRVAQRYHKNAREWVLGLNVARLDDRTNELFFGKSMGQHVQEGSRLNVANCDKGRWKVHDLQGTLLFEAAPTVMILVVSYTLLWTISAFAGLVMGGAVFLYFSWSFFLNFRVARVCAPIDQEFRRINRHRLERWESIERVKTSAKESEEIGKLDGWFNTNLGRDRKFWLWMIDQEMFRGSIVTIALTAVIGYGAWQTWHGAGSWSVGMLYPLIMWSYGVVDNLWRVGDVEHKIHWNMPAVRSMIEALSLKPDIVVQDSAPQVSREEPITISFEGVSHTYPLGEEINGDEWHEPAIPVLSDVSFEIHSKEKVALIAPSGAGKTTLMRLLLRFMDPDRGRILVNGENLRELVLSSWLHGVGYIPQHAQVLDGTVRYNLTYGMRHEEREKISDAELWELMRLLKIDFGSRLTRGLDTLVGRNGIKLSGGQAQRLMIGAAAIKRPRFMIIDEATSHLDSTTEKAVHDGLAEVLKGEVSALVVAHRLSTIRDLCTKFVVLRPTDEIPPGESQIEAVGMNFPHLHLVSPTFRRLSQDQGIQLVP